MAIDIQNEKVIPLRDVPKLWSLEHHGTGRPSLATVYRWALKGTGGITLEWVEIRGVKCTSPTALRLFSRKLQRAQPTTSVSGIGSSQGRQAQVHPYNQACASSAKP